MGLKLITPPTVEPVTAAEAKAFLPALAGTPDATVDLWITAARETFDGWNGILGRALITQTWELQVDAFPLSIPWGVDQPLSSAATEIRIPLVPVQSVSQVAYDDVDGIQQIIDPADYYLDSTSEPAWLFPVADVPWPTAMTAANAVRVRFVAGYGTGFGCSQAHPAGHHPVRRAFQFADEQGSLRPERDGGSGRLEELLRRHSGYGDNDR
jgi:uncharacterized phiE125 gp8 family phage protein